MVTIFDNSDINVNYIALFQNGCIAGNAMAYDMVKRSADRFGKTIVVQWGRDDLLNINNIIMTNSVELTSADAWHHMWLNHFQYFSSKPTACSHAVDFLGCFDTYSHEMFEREKRRYFRATAGTKKRKIRDKRQETRDKW